MNPILFNLYSSNTGLQLEAQFRDAANVALGTPSLAGFIEKGNGEYQWLPSSVPAGAATVDIQNASTHAFLLSIPAPTDSPLYSSTTPISYAPDDPLASYASIPFASSYFAARLHTQTWFDAPEQDKIASLAQSTRAIDRLKFRGTRASRTQTLEFPRAFYIGCWNQHPQSLTIPVVIQQACCENAIALLEGIDPEQENRDLRVTSRRYSSVGTTYDSNHPPQFLIAGIVSFTAWNLLRPWLAETNDLVAESQPWTEYRI